MTDGVNRFPLTDAFVTNVKKDEVNARAGRRVHGKGQDGDPLHADRREHRHRSSSSSTPERARRTTSAARARSANSTPISRPPASTATPSTSRHHLAFPRRPHQRPAHARQQAGVPQCGDTGAGGGVEVFMDDAEMSQPDDRAHEGRVQQRPPRVRRARPQGDARMRPDKEIVPGITSMATCGHTPGHILAHRRVGHRARSTCRRTSPTCRSCSCAIPVGT